jgi:hypothetical protein
VLANNSGGKGGAQEGASCLKNYNRVLNQFIAVIGMQEAHESKMGNWHNRDLLRVPLEVSCGR